MAETLGFVILHYNVIKETVNCVESIERNIDTDSYYIVIVDNASPNNSGVELEKKYAGNSKIKVIRNSENLGFARGNNIGYKYAVEVLECDFVCVLNNDTLLIQKNFFTVILNEYKCSQFAVLGPRIILKDGSDHFLYYKLPDLDFLIEDLKHRKRQLWERKWRLNYVIVAFELMKEKVYKLFGRKKVSKYKKYQMHEGTHIRREDIILHGCCLVFSPQYYAMYKEAFHPGTFLYREEELLYLRCKNKRLKIVYNPELLIKHIEDVATDSVVQRKGKKITFQLVNEIKSLQVLIDEMKKNSSSQCPADTPAEVRSRGKQQ